MKYVIGKGVFWFDNFLIYVIKYERKCAHEFYSTRQTKDGMKEKTRDNIFNHTIFDIYLLLLKIDTFSLPACLILLHRYNV